MRMRRRVEEGGNIIVISSQTFLYDGNLRVNEEIQNKFVCNTKTCVRVCNNNITFSLFLFFSFNI